MIRAAFFLAVVLVSIATPSISAQDRYSYNVAASRLSPADIEDFIADAGLADTAQAAIVRALYADLGAAHLENEKLWHQKRELAWAAEERYRKDHPGISDPSYELGLDFGYNQAWYDYWRDFDALEAAFLD